MALANPIDSLEQRLRLNAQVQEKVYIHTDNQSYFLGDTLWYKAYVLCADNLHPTDMSKILYVELLTPDGYLVERQRVIIDHNTQSRGQFALPDTLYSGYYELRAYTRWQLNFNVTERAHAKNEGWHFYKSKYYQEFYRNYEGLYSRVFPIYERPETPGDYSHRLIKGRLKRQVEKEKKGLRVSFYPEGGHIVAGLSNRVAFEVLDGEGKPLDISGTLSNGTTIETQTEGRGLFQVLPQDTSVMIVSFDYQGDKYTSPLPQIQTQGVTIEYNPLGQVADIKSIGVKIGAVAVTCRGKLVHFEPGDCQSLMATKWPTGVNEIVVYDDMARPLAVRQVFVNNGDKGRIKKCVLKSVKSKKVCGIKNCAQPFELLSLQSQLQKTGLRTVSVSVHDIRGDEPAYDDGNALTDLLLAGDLHGFVAHPAYYFESNDKKHRQQLDLLMMIQGWRKYAPMGSLRFQPEKTLQIEGDAYKLDPYYVDDLFTLVEANGLSTSNPCFSGCHRSPYHPFIEPTDIPIVYKDAEDSIYQNRLLIEAELHKGDDVASVVTEADSAGHFSFYVPAFYDQAILFMSAYLRQDSIRRCMASTKDKFKVNQRYSPFYHIARQWFYPKFTQPYSWFQTHQPLDNVEETTDAAMDDSVRFDVMLDNVLVKSKRRRSARLFDKSKPAFVLDFNTLLNETLDRCIYVGAYEPIAYWQHAIFSQFGTMRSDEFVSTEYKDNPIGFNATVEGHYFLKVRRTSRYPGDDRVGELMSAKVLQRKLEPQHIWQVRFFTDFDLRNGCGMDPQGSSPDVWVDVVLIPNDSRRAMRRDRRIVLDGFAYPEQFYHRDYSGVTPTDSTDYRRTLYWNPNAHPDKDGNLKIQFYNGARPAYLKVSMCGVSEDGIIYVNE